MRARRRHFTTWRVMIVAWLKFWTWEESLRVDPEKDRDDDVSWAHRLNQSVSNKGLLTVRYGSYMATVKVWRLVKEAPVCLKTTMAAPQEVSVAASASVILLESIYNWYWYNIINCKEQLFSRWKICFLLFSSPALVKVWFIKWLCWWLHAPTLQQESAHDGLW